MLQLELSAVANLVEAGLGLPDLVPKRAMADERAIGIKDHGVFLVGGWLMRLQVKQQG
ncbi:hypothetical protein D3C78_1949250 [compost metagenome]